MTCSPTTSSVCWLACRCLPGAAVSRRPKPSVPPTGSTRSRCSTCSPRWLRVRWWLQMTRRRGSVATGCWRRFVSTRRNGSTTPSAPSCATATPASMPTSWRPPPKGCAARTSSAGSCRSNRNWRTPRRHGLVRRERRRRSCRTVPVRAARVHAQPAGRSVAARRRSGTRPCRHPHDCALPLRARGRRRRGLFHGRLDRAEQLCRQALDAASVPSDELAAFIFRVRSRVAYSLGDVSRAVEYLEQRGELTSAASAICPCSSISLDGLAAWRANIGDPAGAADAGREALALARQTGNPGLTSQALGALARALVRPDPEQSRTLIAESLELNDALGGIVVDENALSMVVMASAQLGERDAVLRLSARARPWAFAARRHVLLPRGHRRSSRPRRTPRRRRAPRSGRRAPSRPRASRPASHSSRTCDRNHSRPTRRGACERAARTRRRNDRRPSRRVRARCNRAPAH